MDKLKNIFLLERSRFQKIYSTLFTKQKINALMLLRTFVFREDISLCWVWRHFLFMCPSYLCQSLIQILLQLHVPHHCTALLQFCIRRNISFLLQQQERPWLGSNLTTMSTKEDTTIKFVGQNMIEAKAFYMSHLLI